MHNVLKILAEKQQKLEADKRNVFAKQFGFSPTLAGTPPAEAIAKATTTPEALLGQKDRSRSPRREQQGGITTNPLSKTLQPNGSNVPLSELLKGPPSLSMAPFLTGSKSAPSLPLGSAVRGQSQKHIVADNNRGNLVKKWRELSRPKGRPGNPAQNVDIPTSLHHLESWFQQRNLTNMLEFDFPGSVGGWLRFKYTSAQALQAEADWQPALHGTWWYALWQILTTGMLLESTDESKGHEFQIPGVYVTTDRPLAVSYARPQVLFSDDVYYKVMLELRVDMSRKRQRKKTRLEQWVFPPEAVAIVAILVWPGAKVAKGEERLDIWQSDLEVRPAGCCDDGGFGPW